MRTDPVLVTRSLSHVANAPAATNSGLLVGALAIAGALVFAAVGAGGGGGGNGGGGGGTDRNDEGVTEGGKIAPSFTGQFNYDTWRDRTKPYAGLSPEDFETKEYNRDYGLGMVNAAYRYADGGTGAGTLLAMFDTGVDARHADLDVNVAENLSYSYFTKGSDVTDHNGHGTHVAGIMVAEKNGVGMHGVAFGAHLMVLQGLGWKGGPPASMSASSAWADASRRSINAGAIAINHSWSFVGLNGERHGIEMYDSASEIERYLGRGPLETLKDSAKAGLVTVMAAGNDGADNPSIGAGLARHFPELDGHWLAVGAVDSGKVIASYSNRCGQARGFCLVAPGTAIHSTASRDAGSADYRSMSGTSFATPFVTGAIGVLKSNFPELTGAEITRILLDTAEDLGAAGVDEIYGHGLLDLENAIAPQGNLAIKTGSTRGGGEIRLEESWIAGDTVAAGALSTALSGRQMMVSDMYDRGYGVDMGKMIATTAIVMSDAQSALTSFTREPGATEESGSQGYAYATAFEAPYASLIDAPSFSYETYLGDVTLDLGTAFDSEHGSYTSAEISAPVGAHALSLEVGQLYESGQVLGTKVSGAFGDGMNARTSFARIGGDVALERDTAFNLSATWGVSDFQSDGVLRQGDKITSSALAIGVSRKNVFRQGDSLTFGASKPLAMTGGQITIDRPVAMAASEGTTRSSAVYREREEISLHERVRPTDFQIGYSTGLGAGRLAIGTVWRPDTDMGSAITAQAGFSISF